MKIKMNGKQESNLPVVQKNNNLALNNNKFLRKFLDFSKRAGKVIGGLAGCAGCITTAAIASTIGASPVIPAVFLAGGIYSCVKGLNNVVIEKQPSLLFGTQKMNDGSKKIFQSLEIPSYFRGISNNDKACIMGLQTLIGFQRYKKCAQNNGDPLIESDGKMVYPQKFVTDTHLVNLKNLRALEQAGYIEIISEEDTFNLTEYEKKLGIEPKQHRSLLILEQIGFSNMEGIKGMFRAAITGNKKELDTFRKTIKRITFRLTDKDIDFEDIYKKVNGYIPYESKEEEDSLKRLRLMFHDDKISHPYRIPGVLSPTKVMKVNDKYVYTERKDKIDIEYDRFGRPVLNYRARESFGERIERQQKEAQALSNQRSARENLQDELRRGVDLDKFNERTCSRN